MTTSLPPQAAARDGRGAGGITAAAARRRRTGIRRAVAGTSLCRGRATDRGGKLTSKEWAERLGSVLRQAEQRGEVDTGERYYDHWLTALERLVVEKNLTNWNDLTAERETIRDNDHHRREHQLAHDQ